MSILIDDLLEVCKSGNSEYRRVGERMYIAKPEYGSCWYVYKNRILDAFKVLIGRAFAYHYWEDYDGSH